MSILEQATAAGGRSAPHLGVLAGETATSRRVAWLLFGVISLLGPAPAAAEALRVEIVLDMSGSMAARTEQGATRANVARAAVLNALETFPKGTPIALRLYGHRVHKNKKQRSCRDSELVVNFSNDAAEQIIDVFDRVQPLGQTPIEFALQEAAEDFGPPSEAEQAIILLISDGNETCDGDPVGLVDNLLIQGFKIRIYTVGLEVDEDAKKQLREISTKTRGTYVDAQDTEALVEAVVQASEAAVRGERITILRTVPAAESFAGPRVLLDHCNLGAVMSAEISRAAPNVQPDDGGGQTVGGLVLDMQIIEIEARPGGSFKTPHTVTVAGSLRREQEEVGSFTGKRSSLGEALRTRNRCTIIQNAARNLADDIQAWLKEPSMNARLGDLIMQAEPDDGEPAR